MNSKGTRAALGLATIVILFPVLFGLARASLERAWKEKDPTRTGFAVFEALMEHEDASSAWLKVDSPFVMPSETILTEVLENVPDHERRYTFTMPLHNMSGDDPGSASGEVSIVGQTVEYLSLSLKAAGRIYRIYNHEHVQMHFSIAPSAGEVVDVLKNIF